MKIPELVKVNFPKLKFCDCILPSTNLYEDSHYKVLFNDKEIKPWLKWLLSNPKDLTHLQVRTSSGNHFILKKADSDKYLVILNELENTAMLLSFLENLELVGSKEPGESTEESLALKEIVIESNEIDKTDPRIKEAVRIQQMIIPRTENVGKHFKKFFVIHEQQDTVGGDFYWHKPIDNGALLGVIDCTGHSVEGAMTAMVCNSLLNQSVSEFESGGLQKFASKFYQLLSEYNSVSEDVLDYGLGAEIGLFYFDFNAKNIDFLSTGISIFTRDKNGVELLRNRKNMSKEVTSKNFFSLSLKMTHLENIYAFTDGLVDQFNEADNKKLGYKGVQRLIEEESDFHRDYYFKRIKEWQGSNIQYDDITLIGISI